MNTFLLVEGIGVGTSEVFAASDYSQGHHSYQVTTTGQPTGIQIDIEGSLDGIDWPPNPIATHIFTEDEVQAQSALFHIANRPVKFIRASVVYINGGTNTTVTIRGAL